MASALTLGIWPVPSMPPGSVCKVVGLRKYSQVSLCSRAGLSLVPRDPQDTPTEIYLLGTQADAGPSRESQMLGGVTSIQEKIRLFGAVEVLGGLPRAEVATWHCLTQSGRAPHVGTRRQRSRKTLMTTTQGCRPLARAFGERNALLALSHMHVAERVCVCVRPRGQGLTLGMANWARGPVLAVEATERCWGHGYLAWRVVARSGVHSQMGTGQQNRPCSDSDPSGDMGWAASQADG